MKKILKIIGGIFKEDSPISASRIGFFALLIFGMYMGYRMIDDKRSGIEIGAVIGASFTAATALKIVSKKYEVQGYNSRYMMMNNKSDCLKNSPFGEQP